MNLPLVTELNQKKKVFEFKFTEKEEDLKLKEILGSINYDDEDFFVQKIAKIVYIECREK